MKWKDKTWKYVPVAQQGDGYLKRKFQEYRKRKSTTAEVKNVGRPVLAAPRKANG